MTTEGASRVWELLELSPGDSGLVVRRLHEDSVHDLHAVLNLADRTRRLRYERPWTPGGRLPELEQSRAVMSTVQTGDDGRLRIELTLTDPLFVEAFTTLANDIAATTAREPTDEQATAALTGRLGYWQELLRRVGGKGLGAQARQGLFGELYALQHHLLPHLDAESAIDAWTGPTGTNQDLQLPGCAIEVKTSSGQQPQDLVIANERQLDDTGVGTLLLLHLSVDERRGGQGVTLNSAVQAVEKRLVDHPGARARFHELLATVGYLDHQRHLYDEPRYHLREESCYLVDETFPRITEAQLAPGVGAVRYSISLAACQPHRTTLEALHAAVTAAGAGPSSATGVTRTPQEESRP